MFNILTNILKSILVDIKKFCLISDKSLFGSELLSDMLVYDYQSRFSTLPHFYKNNFSTTQRKFGNSLYFRDIFEETNAEYNFLENDLI